jgi:hypothetical protein
LTHTYIEYLSDEWYDLSFGKSISEFEVECDDIFMKLQRYEVAKVLELQKTGNPSFLRLYTGYIRIGHIHTQAARGQVTYIHRLQEDMSHTYTGCRRTGHVFEEKV